MSYIPNKDHHVLVAVGAWLGIFLLTGLSVWISARYGVGSPGQNGRVCTQEAKRCPDGSYVSCTGPNCEFVACPSEGNGQIKFSGEVAYGQTFEHQINQNLMFRFQPDETGWVITVNGTKVPGKAGEDYSGVVTIPLSGARPQYVNADYNGIAYAASWEEREFEFVLNEDDYAKAWKSREILLWPYGHERSEVDNATASLFGDIPRGKGVVKIIDSKIISPSGDDKLGRFSSLKFEVEINLSQEQKPVVDISSWQTYRNEEYGFEFRYPSTWQVGNNGVQSFSQDKWGHGGIEPAGGMTVVVQKGCDSKTTNVNWIQDSYGPGMATFEEKEICKDNFQIFLHTQTVENEQNKLLLERIASTFTVAQTTTAWKTYRNDQYSFEMKYPNDNQLVTDKNNAKIGFVYSPMSCEDTAIACFAYKSDKFPGTNFNGAALSINIARDNNNAIIKTSQDCLEYQKNWDDAGIAVVNGITFHIKNSSDGAGGHVGSIDDYIAFVNNRCFDIRIVFETISDYTDWDLRKMTSEMEQSTLGTFRQAFSTFKFSK